MKTVIAALLATVVLLPAVPGYAQPAGQKSVAAGVTIAVTPKVVGAGAEVWTFAVVLDTHSQDLADDLSKTAVLVDEKGVEHRALRWNGAGPGGHHREGLLSFRAVDPYPKSIEVRIARPGEARPRSFRWTLD